MVTKAPDITVTDKMEIGFNPDEPIYNPDDHDPVNHPKHYTSHPSGIECIEVTRHMGFNLGNAVKYIWRADEKGNDIQDLEKAMRHIQDEINKRKEQDNGNE